MKTWVKLYTNILRDPTFGMLPVEHRGIWAALLALAGEIDDLDDTGITGFVGTQEDAALMIRCDDDEFAVAVPSLVQANLITVKERGIFMVGYAETQGGGECRPEGRVAAWRRAVFERDQYTCQQCGAKGVKLNAHHITPWCLDSRKRFDPNNGITLCIKCHRAEHKHGWLVRARGNG